MSMKIPDRMPTSLLLDPIVARIAGRRDDWVRVDIADRIRLLERAIDGVLALADEWAQQGNLAKGIDPDSVLAGEEWLSGPMTTVRNLRLLVDALLAGGQPPPLRWRRSPDGHAIADVFPRTLRDRVIYSGMTVEVWIERGQPHTQGLIYREKREGIVRPGRLCLVLGAGNISSICPLDVAYKLFVEDQVVLVKMNPVNDYLGPLFRRAFHPLVDAGYLDFVGGDVEVGDYLCTHPEVDSIHLTGSDRTHDAIVWGATAEEQTRRKATGQPRIGKAITSELGCVTPVLVVPGAWSRADVRFHARNVASMVAHNASFNCTAAKVLVLARGWRHREAFLSEVHDVFARLPARRAYYPGAEDRYRAILARYPDAKVLGPERPHVVPWTVIPAVAPTAGQHVLTHEAFCGVLAEVSLDVSTPAEFLRDAVAFTNEHVWGDLSCVVLADGASRRANRDAFERALADLRYGDIGVNVWTGANFTLGLASWGAYPGNSLEHIRSGRGVVHNSFLFDHPHKSIVRGAFRPFPTPIWFADHGNLLSVGRTMTRFEATPSWRGAVALALAALKSS
jgi:hypothetical protein